MSGRGWPWGWRQRQELKFFLELIMLEVSHVDFLVYSGNIKLLGRFFENLNRLDFLLGRHKTAGLKQNALKVNIFQKKLFLVIK